MKEGLDRFKTAARIDGDSIVVFDVDTEGSFVSRYAPFYFFREARYSAGIMRWPGGAKITAMRNPWREFESLPIGGDMRKTWWWGPPPCGYHCS